MATLRTASGAEPVHDASILDHIRRLTDVSLRLRLQRDNAERKQRLTQVEVELYQSWDLLRRRRARRESGISCRA
jgi:Protein of unknown function (DUF2630)